MKSTPREIREASDQNLIKVKKDLIPFNRNSLNQSDIRVETQIKGSLEEHRLRPKSESGWHPTRVPDRVFKIRDNRLGTEVQVVAPGSMCDKLTVDWLFDSYLKSQLKAPNFDMGSVACLRTVGGHINYDYALTRPAVSLEVFPESIELEPYFFESIRGVNFEAFHILRLAAVGGFAKVAIVRKKDTGQIYAMKIIDKNQLQGREKEEYIFEEKRILTQLDHPFLAKVHFIFQTNNFVFFVMDFYLGGDLFHWICRKKAVQEEEIKVMMIELILAIDCLHEKGIIYRDLKPENVMIDWQGHIKLVDFGLSKKLPSKSYNTHSFVGTKGYMSPEVMAKTGHNYLNDVYHIGIFIYDILHGDIPFSESVLESKSTSAGPTIKFRPGLSTEVKELIQMLILADPSNRLGGQDQLRAILLHPWFGELGVQALKGNLLDPKFVPDLSKYNFTDDIINEGLAMLMESITDDIERTKELKTNFFFGFDYDYEQEEELNYDSNHHSSQYKRLNLDHTNSIDTETDETSETPGINLVKIFKNRTKRTRDQLIPNTDNTPKPKKEKSLFSIFFES